ncbi:MAG: dual specificity protein phosphatase family protein [Anaerolineales bacterium]|nr:dual specificity protein phosphatase family protein [Anaerolineales bacterium]MCZ2122301.1 dual specificity protein phosphatase family protein [Anaerolineales bacterium]
MDEIRPWLFIGSYKDTINYDYLVTNSINAMLLFAEKVEQPNIVSLYLPVKDVTPVSNAHILEGLNFIRKHKRSGSRILVACGAGISRSSAFCAASLKEEENLSLFEAFKQVKKQHPNAFPHELIWNSFCAYYQESVPYLEIMRLGYQ